VIHLDSVEAERAEPPMGDLPDLLEAEAFVVFLRDEILLAYRDDHGLGPGSAPTIENPVGADHSDQAAARIRMDPTIELEGRVLGDRHRKAIQRILEGPQRVHHEAPARAIFPHANHELDVWIIDHAVKVNDLLRWESSVQLFGGRAG
jgi:hypothetical protein